MFQFPINSGFLFAPIVPLNNSKEKLIQPIIDDVLINENDNTYQIMWSNIDIRSDKIKIYLNGLLIDTVLSMSSYYIGYLNNGEIYSFKIKVSDSNSIYSDSKYSNIFTYEISNNYVILENSGFVITEFDDFILEERGI